MRQRGWWVRHRTRWSKPRFTSITGQRPAAAPATRWMAYRTRYRTLNAPPIALRLGSVSPGETAQRRQAAEGGREPASAVSRGWWVWHRPGWSERGVTPATLSPVNTYWPLAGETPTGHIGHAGKAGWASGRG